MPDGLIIKPYEVTVSGYGTHRYCAATRGRALSKAFGDWTGARGEGTFKQFLKLASARQQPINDPRFGEEMTVSGKPAFYVSHDRQYIQFVRPGSDVILHTHPLDVEPPEARRGTPYYADPAERAAESAREQARTMRLIVRDFLISLTDGGKNSARTLSIDHDELAALVVRSRDALQQGAEA